MQNTHETYIMDKEQESLQINNEHCPLMSSMNGKERIKEERRR